MKLMKGAVLALFFAVLLFGSTAAQAVPDPSEMQAPPPEDTTANAVSILRDTVAGLNPDGRGLPANVAARVRQARTHTAAALNEFVGVEPRLPVVLTRMAAAANALETAKRLSSNASVDDELTRHQTALIGVARGVADGLLQVATNAGVDRARLIRAQASIAAGDQLAGKGKPGPAINIYKKVLSLKNNIVFDPDVFEAQVRQALDSQTTGYAVALNVKGKLVNSWGDGDRLTIQDTNIIAVPMTPDNEMNIASVSKTLTATMALYHMADEGISIDDPIADYLPGDWTLGANIDDPENPLTFRHLLTHTSGLGGRNLNTNARQGCGTSFASMQACLAQGSVLADRTFFYDNGNFALFRIMMPYLDGKWCNDPNNADCPVATEANTSEAYRRFAQCSLFTWMGISTGEALPDLSGCVGPDVKPNSNEGVETPMHWAPDPTVPSRSAGDWTNSVGGGGWYFSAHELARFMAYMRYDNTILPVSTRNLMYQNFLGWMDPLNYSWAMGKFVPYHFHGGDLCAPFDTQPAGVSVCSFTIRPRGVDTCIADFPDGVQAALLINSMGGDYNGAAAGNVYQCVVLKTAYENAFVVK